MVFSLALIPFATLLFSSHLPYSNHYQNLTELEERNISRSEYSTSRRKLPNLTVEIPKQDLPEAKLIPLPKYISLKNIIQTPSLFFEEIGKSSCLKEGKVFGSLQSWIFTHYVNFFIEEENKTLFKIKCLFTHKKKPFSTTPNCYDIVSTLSKSSTIYNVFFFLRNSPNFIKSMVSKRTLNQVDYPTLIFLGSTYLIEVVLEPKESN
jgi:hypothetical protein